MSFRSKPVVLGTTDTDIYEVPVTLSAVVVLGIHNVDPSPTPSFTLKYYKQSTDTTTTLGTITFESSPSFKYEVPFSMEPGDKLIGSASAENAVVVTPFITDNAAIPTAVGFNPIGVWNSGTTYGRNDIVRVEGGGSPYIPGKTYISLQDNNQNQDPETETAYWMVLVEDGPQGVPGDVQLDVANTWTAPQRAAAQEITDSSAADFSAKQRFTANVNGGAFDLVNPSADPQDGTYIAILFTYETSHGVNLGDKFMATGWTPTAEAGKADHTVWLYDETADEYWLVGVRPDVSS